MCIKKTAFQFDVRIRSFQADTAFGRPCQEVRQPRSTAAQQLRWKGSCLVTSLSVLQ